MSWNTDTGYYIKPYETAYIILYTASKDGYHQNISELLSMTGDEYNKTSKLKLYTLAKEFAKDYETKNPNTKIYFYSVGMYKNTGKWMKDNNGGSYQTPVLHKQALRYIRTIDTNEKYPKLPMKISEK
jgi:hypothetical protein